jgi:NTP pyrophosphohydrolases including oxidative damage repair enzymes
MTYLKEKTIKNKIVFKGNFLTLNNDKVLLPNGNTSTREWIEHPGAVCCIPILPDGKIGLIKQYRYAVKEQMIEIPAGKLDQNEKPEKCALRELEEEIGYKANKLTLLANIYPAVGFTDEKMWLYLAENLVKTKQNLDADEFLDLFPTKLNDAVDMVWSGKITDVKTIIGILWAQRTLLDEI